MFVVQTDEPSPPDPYNPDFLRDAEGTFNIIAYARDHPIIAGLIALVLVVFVVWMVRRGRR